MAADPDEELVARARSGSLEAFGSLVERHRDVVYRVAARIVGAHNAADVSQDAFLRAFNRLYRFRGEGPFRAWLLQITHNAALREAGLRRPEPVDLEQDSVGDPEPSGPDRTPAATLERRERRERRERLERLERKISLLSPNHRSVLVLRDVEGLSYEDIASITEFPLGSVKGPSAPRAQRAHRAAARQHLRLGAAAVSGAGRDDEPPTPLRKPSAASSCCCARTPRSPARRLCPPWSTGRGGSRPFARRRVPWAVFAPFVAGLGLAVGLRRGSGGR